MHSLYFSLFTLPQPWSHSYHVVNFLFCDFSFGSLCREHHSQFSFNLQVSLNTRHRLLFFSPSVISYCNPMPAACQASRVLHCLPEFAQTLAHWINDATQPSHPLSSPSLAFNFSQHQDVSNEPALRIRWPKYWSFSISLSNEYSGLISFRIDWSELLAVQGTPKSLLQHDSSKAPVPQLSAFFMVQTHIHIWLLGKP